MAGPDPLPRLEVALAARATLVDAAHETAFRLFNGHLEGDPRWVIDAYGRTAVVYRHGEPDDAGLAAVLETLRARLPWLATIVVKEREGLYEARRGQVAFRAPGSGGPDTQVAEHGVRYAVDPLLNQDAGFYLDTRELRRWLLEHTEGQTVLNTFAYTGSLGVAALAGGAARVLQTDLNPRFLDVARASTALNGLPVEARDFVARDFFSFVRGAKLRGERFDVAILDPPFFSSTPRGELDLSRDTTRLVNKVRPLVRGGGKLVVVNNALFLSGAALMVELEALCAGGWMTIEALIGVPPDVAGYPETRVGAPPVDPAPFDHSTKIAVLGVRHR
jgi:23S rRNA (cytosine1962-C5)-methyltransferase